MILVLTIVTWLLALGWLWQAVIALRGMPKLSDLTLRKTAREANTSEQSAESEAPDLTVIVPACNEEGSIEATLRSLLASTGLRLQIIAIDDRSTDQTGARMDSVAADLQATNNPHQLEVIHNRELPAGWLGKTHALALGVARAKATWLLFTDADVRFDPRACALALDYATAESADHVLMVFTMDFQSRAESAVLAAFALLASWQTRLWKIADPKARDFFGAGGFNMIRRDVYEKLGGFESLRMEVLEDARLGWKVKRAGFAQRIVLGPGLLRLRWIEGAFGIVRLLEKNGFAASRYRIGFTLLALLAFLIQAFVPLIAIASLSWATLPGLLFYVFLWLAYFANRRVTQASAWMALTFAPAVAILTFAMARSMCLALMRGGVMWRGTLYSLDELRRNAGGGWE